MAYLEVTMRVAAKNRSAAAEVYSKYKSPFLAQAQGAKSKALLIREEDVQVLHEFDTIDNAKAYLGSNLFTSDIVGELKPLLQGAPDVRIYQTL